MTRERRRTARQRVLRGGVIALEHIGTIAQCMVRNLSASGACLVVDDPAGVPSEFGLTLDREKGPRACRVIWPAENKIGVEFQ